MPGSRSSWRRLNARHSLRVVQDMLEPDEESALHAVNEALTKCDSWCAERHQQVPREQAMGEARKAFAEEVRRITVAAIEERDLRIARAAQQDGASFLCALRTLGELLPCDMQPSKT